MQIQPITAYRLSGVNTGKKIRKAEEPVNQPENQPSFKGIKGLLKGAAAGAGITAGGVALIAGAAAVPVFLSYIVINGAISAGIGHMIEDQYKKEDGNKYSDKYE